MPRKKSVRISSIRRSLGKIHAYLQSPIARIVPRQVRLERIQQIFARKSLGELLNDKFLDGLEKRRDLLQARALKVFAVQVTVLGILLLCLLPVKVNVTLFDVQATELRQLRELLLVIFTSLALLRFQMNAESAFVKECLQGAISAKAAKDKEVLYMLRHRYGIGGFPHWSIFLPKPTMYPAGGYFIVLYLLRGVSVLLNLAEALTFLVVEIWAMIDIYQIPSVNRPFAVAVIAYSFLVTIAIMLWSSLGRTRFVYRELANMQDI
jgi:hypothetical protein